jgi:hypothetical protein
VWAGIPYGVHRKAYRAAPEASIAQLCSSPQPSPACVYTSRSSLHPDLQTHDGGAWRGCLYPTVCTVGHTNLHQHPPLRSSARLSPIVACVTPPPFTPNLNYQPCCVAHGRTHAHTGRRSRWLIFSAKDPLQEDPSPGKGLHHQKEL